MKFIRVVNYSAMVMVLFSALLLTACSARVKVSVVATPNASLDSEGKPLSVVVRIYQLKDVRIFASSSFHDLWKNDLRILGHDLLSREEIQVIPNSTRKLQIKKQANVKYVGVVALFRNPKSGKWRIYRSTRHDYVTRRLKLSQGYKITLRNNELIMD